MTSTTHPASPRRGTLDIYWMDGKDLRHEELKGELPKLVAQIAGRRKLTLNFTDTPVLH